MEKKHAGSFGNNLVDFMDKSLKDLNTELFISLIRPQFDILGAALAEIDELFKDKFENW
jgi:hypothetical protein